MERTELVKSIGRKAAAAGLLLLSGCATPKVAEPPVQTATPNFFYQDGTPNTAISFRITRLNNTEVLITDTMIWASQGQYTSNVPRGIELIRSLGCQIEEDKTQIATAMAKVTLKNPNCLISIQ